MFYSAVSNVHMCTDNVCYNLAFEAIEGQRDQSIHFVLRLAQTELVAIVGFTCIARAQKPVHASGSTVVFFVRL